MPKAWAVGHTVYEVSSLINDKRGILSPYSQENNEFEEERSEVYSGLAAHTAPGTNIS